MESSTILTTFAAVTSEMVFTDGTPSADPTALGDSLSTAPAEQEVEGGLSAAVERSCLVSNYVHSFVLLGLLFLMGTTGNTLTIIVLWAKRNKNSTSLLLIWLAVFDNGVVVMRFINNGLPALCKFYEIGEAYLNVVAPITTGYGWPLQNIFHTGGCWIVVLVTLQRYVAVCWPTHMKYFTSIRKTRVQILVVFVFSVAFCVPRFVIPVYTYDAAAGKLLRGSRELNNLASYAIGYKLVAFYLINFILPFGALVFMTVKLIIALRQSAKRRETLTQRKKDDNEMNVTLVAVVVLFLICQLAIPIRRLCTELLSTEEQACGQQFIYYATMLSNLPALNSAVNFLLYFMFSKSFRKDFMRIILRKVNAVEPTQEMTNNTRNLQVPDTSMTGSK